MMNSLLRNDLFNPELFSQSAVEVEFRKPKGTT